MNMSRRIPDILLPAILVLLAGCAASTGTPDASESEPAESALPSASAPGSASEEAAGSPAAKPDAPAGIPDDVWAAILADLERRLGEPAADPTVLTATAQTWTDGSLGCPVAGQMYTQALVDGYQVILEVDGQQYDYRVGSGTDVRLCQGG